MFEAIIMAVGSIISGLLSGNLSRGGKEQGTEISISELEKTIENRINAEISAAKDDIILYINQALQLFFTVLLTLNIQYNLSIEDDKNKIINIELQNQKIDEMDLVDAVSSNAQRVLDWKTIKPISDIVHQDIDITVLNNDTLCNNDQHFLKPVGRSVQSVLEQSKEKILERRKEADLL